MSRFRTRLEGLDFNLHPKKPMAFGSTATETLFGVTVMSGGGFDSTTDRHKFAAALAGHDRPTEVLHIGDHDPSGVSMFLAFLEDVEAYARELDGQAIGRSGSTGYRQHRPRQPTDAPLPARPVRPRHYRPTCSPISCAPPSNAALISVCLIMCCCRNGASAAN